MSELTEIFFIYLDDVMFVFVVQTFVFVAGDNARLLCSWNYGS